MNRRTEEMMIGQHLQKEMQNLPALNAPKVCPSIQRKFLGRFQRSVSKDGRVSLPSDFRSKLAGDVLVAMRNMEDRGPLVLVPRNLYEQGGVLRPTCEQTAIVRIDARGRIRIPTGMMSRGYKDRKNSRTVEFVGQISTIMVCNASNVSRDSGVAESVIAIFDEG